MLKKLRIKFIAYIMAIITLVLTVVFITVCVLDYHTRLDQVYSELTTALQYTTTSLYDSHSSNVIHGSVSLDPGSHLVNSGDVIPVAEYDDGDTAPGDAPVIIGNTPQIGAGSSNTGTQAIPLAVYIVAPDDAVYILATLTTASITDEVREQAIQEAKDADALKGFLKNEGLYYVKRNAFGYSCISFADESAVSSWHMLAWTLTGVGSGTLVVFFLISLFFSRWALKPVENAWRAQNQFTADASHELKTPLTVILANMSILRSHGEDTVASQSQWIESTQTEAEHMQLMVNDMLALARPEDNARVETLMVDTDLSDLVEGDALQFESVAFERGITLTSELDENVHIRGDANRLHRLTSTLIDNACKYADEGGMVDIRLKKSPRDIRFIVHNSGTTIAPEDIPHVFDRFYRADKSRNRASGSYGLGLAIAREVAQEHGGDITVQSAPEAGTTFTVTLPLTR